MNIPPFSIFSAVSEIFVTIGVLYAIIRAVRGHGLARWLLGGTLLFEASVNIIYMAGRAAQADSGTELSTGMKLFYAGHGTLSLLMFLVLAIIYMWSLYGESKKQDNWFYRHKTWSWVLVFFWMVSVTTGEAIFVMRYLM